MNAQRLLFVLMIIADLALWIAGAIAPLSSRGRFRTFAAAIALLVVLCGGVIGWTRTAFIGGLAMWLAAIVASSLPGRTVRPS